ncbi:FAD/FMN-containing dehydrogenase [Flavobacterium sp. 90]|uniref:FAD-binding oxidoreductase n=1 Tax=unclassified Flavobacterium TaxID=196869 RepID=UPI000F16AF3A|nr:MULTISPECIES: FAD-dependent oxidoreductase [unclassified Flavobacterium]RKR08286.1 FAD/FMN-containing dehydrogenase [Flavobacterium sp. 81]TCK57474.1 FAD/FMN-containing dehydrogenase [Flavobacterium sp. 90]
MKKIYRFILFIVTYLLKIIKLIWSGIKSAIRFINRKKRRAIPFYGFLLFVLYIFLLIQFSGDSKFNTVIEDKTLNDITQINPIQANKIIRPKTENEIIDAIKNTTGPISIGGGKYSMGGQTAFENSLHIDMRSFNKIVKIDTTKKQITVQAGIRWRDIQKVIDPLNLSIKIMQTYSNFTVGGAISVNCHGRYIGHGPIISSVLELKIITAKGDIIIANREVNQEVFNAAIGGYGGIGVIAEATLQLVDNEKVERFHQVMDIEDYKAYFDKNIRNNTNVVFQNGNLYPPKYDKIMSISWEKTTKPLTDTERLIPEDENYLLESRVSGMVSWGNSGKWIREYTIDPLFYFPEIVRWRNKEASYDVKELEPASREKETYVLQEYFIPVENIKSFIPKMSAIFQNNKVNVINVSLRHALPDHESYLSWANKEVFAFVIYYKQGTNQEAKDEVKKWTLEMTDAILSENGTWYLPYQPHATIEQFQKGYPNSAKYFEIKNKLDPDQRFTNKLLDKYNPYAKNNLSVEKKKIKDYFRAEEQTILTVPEWYLVYNPKEYADYLKSGKNPSDFPFYKSIDEYWKLYDRSLKLTSKAYPENSEYKTMLQVIGASMTMEYGAKIIYENTTGRFFSLFAEKQISKQEQTIIEAQSAYSDFIYQTAWYEFNFLDWIKKVWNVSDNSNCSTLRKWERTLLFTFEFSFKAFYSQLIQWAAQSTYETPSNLIYLIVSNTDAIKENKDLKIIKKGNDKMIIAVTRWGAFTTEMIKLSNQDVKIYEISGNDEIAVSTIMDNSKNINLANTKLLYQSGIVTDDKLKRNVYFLPVDKLLPFIKKAKNESVTIEHVYDY